MQRLYWLLAIVLVLGGLYFFLQPASSTAARGSHLVSEREFKVADVSTVSRIFLADRTGQQTDLTRDGKIWIVDGKYPANETAIKNLLDVVARIDMQHIPAKAAIPAIITNLATEGILVQLFNQRGEKLKGYYIGGSTPDERGTYAIMEGAEQPYVVHLPSWVGNLRFRLNFFGDHWRSKQIFQEEISQIEQVTVEYPTQRNRSFILRRQGESYEVSPFYETEQPKRSVPRERAERYLYNYEKLFVSSFENEATEEKAGLLKSLPFATIRLTLTNGTEKVLKAYPRFADRKLHIDSETGDISTDEPLLAYTLLLNEDVDMAVVQPEMLQPFLLSYQSF